MWLRESSMLARATAIATWKNIEPGRRGPVLLVPRLLEAHLPPTSKSALTLTYCRPVPTLVCLTRGVEGRRQDVQSEFSPNEESASASMTAF